MSVRYDPANDQCGSSQWPNEKVVTNFLRGRLSTISWCFQEHPNSPEKCICWGLSCLFSHVPVITTFSRCQIATVYKAIEIMALQAASNGVFWRTYCKCSKSKEDSHVSALNIVHKERIYCHIIRKVCSESACEDLVHNEEARWPQELERALLNGYQETAHGGLTLLPSRWRRYPTWTPPQLFHTSTSLHSQECTTLRTHDL